MRVEIYDPALCCSSGLCGPDVEPVLVQMNDTVRTLQKQGVEIKRFNLAQQTKEFMSNQVIADLLHKAGKKVLPVTVVNGDVLKTGEYASYAELCRALGIELLQNT